MLGKVQAPYDDKLNPDRSEVQPKVSERRMRCGKRFTLIAKNTARAAGEMNGLKCMICSGGGLFSISIPENVPDIPVPSVRGLSR